MKYSGEIAKNYTAKREKSFKWQWENDRVEEHLEALMPQTVLDAPVGAGRFSYLYKILGIDAVGLDISPDMLAQVEGMPVIEGSLFLHVGRYECVLCIRFLNWLSPAEFRAAMKQIHNLADSAIISITTARTYYVKRTGAHIFTWDELEAALGEFEIIRADSRHIDESTAWILTLKK